jgi:acyl-coenzyme A synthetase/AMP-(fatty) acid ligase/acyl carrier protein
MPVSGGRYPTQIAAHVLPLDHGGPVDVPFELFTDDWIDRPVFERFEYIVERYGDRIALDDGLARYTYDELMRASARLAQRIDALAPSQAPVGILLPNCALVPIAALACLAVGRPFVPMDCDFPALRNEQIMAEAGLQALIVDTSNANETRAFASLPQIDIASSLANDADGAAVSTAAVGGPALILYTSGSTGRPKGTCHNQRSMSYCVAQLTNSCHLNADDRIVLLNTAGTVVGIRNIFAALLNGASLFIADPRSIGIQGVLRTLQYQRITFCNAVPTLLRELAKAKEIKRSFANLRVLRLGGEAIRANDVALLKTILPSSCCIQLSYGLTESASIFQWFAPATWNPDGPRTPCGYSVPEQSIWLAQETDAPASRGELIVKSQYLALGYWQNGSLQRGSFEQDPDDPSLRILCTGDLVQLRDDGLVEIVGRKDRQVKINGLPVNPAEVEDALCRCDGVSEAVVTSRRDQDVVTLTAYVVPSRPVGESFIKDLRTAVVGCLPGYMRPARIRVVSKIPLLPRFKPDIAALEQLEDSLVATTDVGEKSEVPFVQSGRIKAAVSQAWIQVLGRQSFEANLPWHQTGGDSLKKIRLWLEIEKALGMRLPFEAFNDHATLNEIAVNVEKAMTDLVPLRS